MPLDVNAASSRFGCGRTGPAAAAITWVGAVPGAGGAMCCCCTGGGRLPEADRRCVGAGAGCAAGAGTSAWLAAGKGTRAVDNNLVLYRLLELFRLLPQRLRGLLRHRFDLARSAQLLLQHLQRVGGGLEATGGGTRG